MFIARDPTVDLKRPKKVSYDAPRCLTVEEYLSLKKAIHDGAYLKDLRKDKRIEPEEFLDLVDFYLLTGISRSDGRNVPSENFNFEGMIATLPLHKQGTTKTVPIGKDLGEVAGRLIARAGKGKPVVRYHVNSLTYNFALGRAKAGLPSSITFHSIRHTFISWLASLGTDIKTVQVLAGHQSLESTRMYLHSFDANKRAAIEKLVLPKAKAG
jgi:integrase